MKQEKKNQVRVCSIDRIRAEGKLTCIQQVHPNTEKHPSVLAVKHILAASKDLGHYWGSNRRYQKQAMEEHKEFRLTYGEECLK